MGLFSHHTQKADAPSAAAASPPSYPGNGSEQKGFPQSDDLKPGREDTSASASGLYNAPPSIFGALLLSRTDRIRIIGFPPNVTSALGEAIQRAWPVGIQQAEPYDQASFEWKLRGNPWQGFGSEAVPARRLIIHVLHCLASQGWHLHASCDLSKKEYDKDSLLFRAGPPVQRIFFSISFNEYDKIRLIDSPNEQTKQAFIRAVRMWPRGIQDEKEKEPQCFQMKLRGHPWITSDGTEVNAARMLACNILSAMDHQGFELVGSVDMSIDSSGTSRDLDTWFFAAKSA